MFVIRPYRSADKEKLIALWKKCDLVNPKNDPEKDIARKMKVNPEWLLVGVLEGEIIASVMIGYEGHRGWLNYLGVDPEHQGCGLGRMIVNYAENILRSVDCPKINLQVRSSNSKVVKFYESLGFQDEQCIGMGKRLVDDEVK